ncbi:MAG: hypothetical protein WD043_11300 [Gemmatimonadales bacterium]
MARHRASHGRRALRESDPVGSEAECERRSSSSLLGGRWSPNGRGASIITLRERLMVRIN